MVTNMTDEGEVQAGHSAAQSEVSNTAQDKGKEREQPTQEGSAHSEEEYEIPYVRNRGYIDINNPEEMTEPNSNGYVVRFIKTSGRRQLRDAALWDLFGETFYDWKKQHFEVVTKEIQTELRDYLRQHGVLVPKVRGGNIAGYLAQVAVEETPTQWSEQDISAQLSWNPIFHSSNNPQAVTVNKPVILQASPARLSFQTPSNQLLQSPRMEYLRPAMGYANLSPLIRNMSPTPANARVVRETHRQKQEQLQQQQRQPPVIVRPMNHRAQPEQLQSVTMDDDLIELGNDMNSRNSYFNRGQATSVHHNPPPQTAPSNRHTTVANIFPPRTAPDNTQITNGTSVFPQAPAPSNPYVQERGYDDGGIRDAGYAGVVAQARNSGFGREVSEVRKAYNKESMQYSGSEDSLTLKLKIFTDICEGSELPKEQYHKALPAMLKGAALDYYYDEIQGKTSNYQSIVAYLKQNFETAERTNSYQSEWNRLTLSTVMKKNPEKNMAESFEILLSELRRVQRGLPDQWQGNEALRLRVQNACKGVKDLMYATFKPASTLQQLCEDIRASISAVDDIRDTEQGTYITEQGTFVQDDFEYPQAEQYYIDRQYKQTNGRGGFNNRENSYTRTPFRSNFNQRGGYKGSRGGQNGESQRPEKCIVDGKIGCWSTNHSIEEQKKAWDKIQGRLYTPPIAPD